jgi:dTDP-4-dehydrorhamnose 3,5-epimerase
MHFQNSPYAEIKLVSCLRGAIWDVAVDLRHNSPTFLKWYAEKLTPENYRALLIPEGFAHGFQTLDDDCELLYFHSSPYKPTAESGVCATDPKLGIVWPLEISELSQRDSSHPLIADQFKGI